MPARRALAVLVSVLAVALSACTTPQGAESTASRSGSSTQPIVHALWDRLGGTGFVYFQANTDGKKHYELFRVDLATGEETQVTDLPGPFGISNFSVSSGGLVVADASSLVDEAAWVRPDGSLDRLPGPRVLSPEVSDDGAVLASVSRDRAESLMVLPAGESRWQHVVDLKGWTTWWWIDRETAMLVRIGGHQTTWQPVDVDGRSIGVRRRIAHGILYPNLVTQDGQSLVLAARRGSTGRLWQPGEHPERLPEGWEYGCVSPDGHRLLLMSHHRFGVLDSADLNGQVRMIGTFKAKILGCGWVEEKYGP